jgi:putative hydrolase
MFGSCKITHFHNLSVIPRKLNGVIVLRGVEANIMDIDGNIDISSNLQERLEIVIASLHKPIINPASKEENTLAVINTMKKNQGLNVIGHLADPRYKIDPQQIVSNAKKYNVAIELNNTSLNPTNPRAGGEMDMINLINECKNQKAFVTIGSDAHIHTDIGEFGFVSKIIEKSGLSEDLILNTSIEKLLNFLQVSI